MQVIMARLQNRRLMLIVIAATLGVPYLWRGAINLWMTLKAPTSEVFVSLAVPPLLFGVLLATFAVTFATRWSWIALASIYLALVLSALRWITNFGFVLPFGRAKANSHGFLESVWVEHQFTILVVVGALTFFATNEVLDLRQRKERASHL
jgi:hypothetical protein